MRSCITVTGLAAALGLVCGSMAAAAEQQKPGQEFDMEAWTEFAKLAPQRELFEHVVGQWKVETKETWPGMEKPIISRGTSTFRLMMGGRFLEQRYESDYQGTEFRGLAIYGYDKAKKKYVSLWLDNMNTGMMVSEGQYDEGSDQLVLVGEGSSTMGKMRMKSAIKPVDENKLIITYYITMHGAEEHQAIVTTYTRQK